jgi:MazG family protein
MNFPTDKFSNFVVMKREKELLSYERLLDIMDELREKCPWDRKQTMESLRPNTIEETYELCDAIVKGDLHNVAKELGDVLLHVVFYAKIGSEKGAFDMSDVCNMLCDKLVYRHPHVFGDVTAETAGDVIKNWEQLKRTEKDGNKTVLSGVPDALPSLIKAYRIQDKARAVGFDWEKREDVWDKVTEEIGEFRTELDNLSDELDSSDQTVKYAARRKAEVELGDLIFSLVNAARLYDLNPDSALEYSNNKFKNRFTYVELKAKEAGRDLRDMTLGEMDELWNEAKNQGL